MTGDWPRCGESRHISAGKRRGRETNGAAMAKPSRESAAKTSTGTSNRQCFLFPPSVRTIISISAGVLLSHGAPLSLVSRSLVSLRSTRGKNPLCASQITPGSVRGARQNQAQILNLPRVKRVKRIRVCTCACTCDMCACHVACNIMLRAHAHVHAHAACRWVGPRGWS